MKAMSDILHKIWGILKGINRKQATIGAIALLLILVCILSIMQMNMHRKYTSVAEGITEQIFQNLSTMEELFSYVDQENIDVRNKLIPQMRMQYTAVKELNTVLINNYGIRYAVLSQQQLDDFDAAFKEYNTAIDSGLSLNLARDDMAILLSQVQDMINAHYNPTPEPTTTPVTIGTPNKEPE